MQERIVILGGGESGIGAALLALKQGYEVFVSDGGAMDLNFRQELEAKGISFEENGHTDAQVLVASMVIKSPGIPESAAIVKKIRASGIPLISEIEFASRFTKSRMIAITGTNGKTTTTLLTYHLLKSAGLDVEIAGNIGESFARKLSHQDHDYFVLEISSFQLDDIIDFSPHVAMLLNITPDHLNRYGDSLEKYAAAKFSITKNQQADDYFIFNAENDIITTGLKERKVNARQVDFGNSTGMTVYSDGERLFFSLAEKFEIKINELPLIGVHNVQNAMAAISAASLVGIKATVITEHLAAFKNAKHRLEFVAEIDGVRFINDSKATNVDAVYYALEGVKTDIIWIAGGVDKGNDYQLLNPFVAQGKVKTIICLGKDNRALIKAFSSSVICEEFRSIEAAVCAALDLASPGMTVLLSPACASFDLFKNYEDRGEQFCEQVRQLEKKRNEMAKA